MALEIDITGGYTPLEIDVVGGVDQSWKTAIPPSVMGYVDPSTGKVKTNIQSFVSSFTNSDVSKASRYEVTLFVPRLFKDSPYGDGIPTTEHLSLRCENASFPGRTLQTQELKTYGPVEKFPYQSSYDDITLTFICSSSMIEKNLFDLWMEYINPEETWNFRFKNNYITPILITQYDGNFNYTHQIQLVDAFPVSVTPLELDWSAEGYHKLAVTFAYTYWKHSSEYAAEKSHQPVDVNSPFYIKNLSQIISGVSLAKDIARNMGKSPYGLLSAIGAASSILSGTNITLSSLLNGSNPYANRVTSEESVGLIPGDVYVGGSDVNNFHTDK